MLEQSLRIREKETKALEQKVQAQEEALQNINKILDHQERSIASLTTLQQLYATSSGPREVAAPYLELAVKAARCEAGILALREGAQSHLTVLAALGDRQELVRHQLLTEGEGIIGEVVKAGEPLVVPDGRRDPRLKRETPEAIQKEPRNAMCIPVVGVTCVWGAVLLVNTIDRKRFNKQDLDLQNIFAMRLARELERELEYARAREETARFSTLLRVTELLHVSGDRQKVCDLLVQLATRLTKAKGVAVFLLDEGLQMLSCCGATERQLRTVQAPMGTGVAGTVALEGRPVAVDMRKDARFAGQVEPVFSFRVDTLAAVPIKGARRIIGVLEVVNKVGTRGFDQGDTNLLALLAREAGIALDHLEQSRQDQRTIMELLKGMARFLDSKSPQMAGHSERVAKLAQTLAEEMGLAPAEVNQAYLGGLLHDLGNVGVEDELFLAPRQLTAEETRQMRQHASIGAEILREVAALRHLMSGPLYHHERFDGGGYPQGLKGEAIPVLARILGVAEAFDAVRSARPYREAMSLPDALAHVRASEGSLFDPKVVAALVGAYQRGKLPT